MWGLYELDMDPDSKDRLLAVFSEREGVDSAKQHMIDLAVSNIVIYDGWPVQVDCLSVRYLPLYEERLLSAPSSVSRT